MKNKIVVLGGSYLQSDFIETAKRVCSEVYVLDRDKNCYARFMDGISFHEIDISDRELVENFFLDTGSNLIITPVTEIGNRVAAEVADRHGIPYNSLDAVKATTDKWVMRNRLKESDLNEPYSERFIDSDRVMKTFSFPLIVKPPISSASRGVSLVNSPDELSRALDEALKFTARKSEILIEEYIEGKQYSIETISAKGKHFIVGIAREYISEAPYFVERTNIVSPEETEQLYDSFQGYINRLLTLLGITIGPCHVEVKVREGDIYLIEAASRSGLLRDRLLKTARCSDYNELILRAYTGDTLTSGDIRMPGINALLGILMTPEDLSVYLEVKKQGLIADEFFNGNGPKIEPKRLTDAFGYFFIAGDNEILNYKLI